MDSRKSALHNKRSAKESYKRAHSLRRGIKRMKYERSVSGRWNGEDSGYAEDRANRAEDIIERTQNRRKSLGVKRYNDNKLY